MADARRLDPSLVRAVLGSRAPAVRAAAALTVGQVMGSELSGTLRTLLADPDTAVAANAAYALGLLHDTTSVTALEGLLASAGPVSIEAAWALGEIGEPARGSIVRALREPPRPAVAGALLLAAAKLRPVPVAATIPYLRHRDAEVRWRAAYSVARPYVAAGARAVLGAASDESAAVRAQVARALSREVAGDSLGERALVALAALSRDREPHVRINALRALGTYGTAGRDPIVAATRDGDPNVRIAAAQNLGTVLGSGRGEWNAVWEADTSLMYRKNVLASGVKADIVLEAIDEDNPDRWQRLSDWRFRAAVAEAGAAARSMPRIVEIALPLVNDPDGRVRTAAYAAIAPYADSADQHPRRRDFMLNALRDADVMVRATAINSLVGRASAGEAGRVLESYQLAQSDRLNDARIAAVRFLAAAWRRDSAAFPDSLRAALTALPQPVDPLVRAAAVGVSVFDHSAPPVGTARPLPWYEERVRKLIMPALRGHLPRVEIATERGTITLELFPRDAPLTTDNFLSLARQGYYDGLRFHRVVPNFVAQDGDPRGDGNGGPGYAIRDELNRRRYGRGILGMALSGPDTGGSQYFITLSPQPHLDGGYTVFGRVIGGFGALDALVQGDRIDSVRVR